MRIALFTDTYEPDINGVVVSIKTLKEALENLGHTVYVVTNQRSITKTSYEDRILRLPGVELKFLYGYVMSSPLHLQAVSLVEEMDLDIIHAHSEFGVGLFARYLSNALRIPLVSTYHTTYEDYTHYFNVLGIKTMETISRKAVANLSRSWSKRAQIIIAPSEKTKKMLLGYEIQKEISVIPTGLNLERFKNIDFQRLAELKSQYREDGVFTFIYIGRLAIEKSLDVVFESFKALLETGAKAKLLVVGSGPSQEDLMELAKELDIDRNTEFLGLLPVQDIPIYYHLADAFISASVTETQGLTFIEALACGLPVFARPDEPLEDIIIDQKTGFLFNNPKEFVEKATYYMHASPDEKEIFKKNALEKSQSFSAQAFGEAVEALYERAGDVYYGKYLIETLEDHDEEILVKIKSHLDEEEFYIERFLAERRDLEVGQEVSRQEINEIKDDQKAYEGYQLALKRIALRDYSSFEMKNYLIKKKDLNEEQVDVVIALLEKRRFIDDERFLRDRIDYLRSQNRGNYRILEELEKKGFSENVINQALMNEDLDDYIERGIERAQHFLKTQNKGSKRQRQEKLTQHLVRQGYDFTHASRIVDLAKDPYTLELEKESLRKLMRKNKDRFEKRYDKDEALDRNVRQALSKGYNYDMIQSIIKEFENEN